jgi:hypothetical protein
MIVLFQPHFLKYISRRAGSGSALAPPLHLDALNLIEFEMQTISSRLTTFVSAASVRFAFENGTAMQAVAGTGLKLS